MKLFNMHNTIDYSGRTISNILKRITIPSLLKTEATVYYNYILVDNDTPELLAYKLYGDVNKHWIILAMNNIIDPHFDWLLSENEVYRLAEEKYGVGNINDLHHYIDDADNMVWDDRMNDPTGYSLTEVSNIQYEIDENEKKREIKILHSQYVKQFEAEYKVALGE